LFISATTAAPGEPASGSLGWATYPPTDFRVQAGGPGKNHEGAPPKPVLLGWGFSSQTTLYSSAPQLRPSVGANLGSLPATRH